VLEGWVALTGTPGVGKSTVANELRLRGIPNVDVGAFAKDNDVTDGFDEARMSAIIDPKRVAKALQGRTQKGALLLLDGHWSHDMPGITAAIVVRLRPKELQSRLERRGWPSKKVRENVEAEATDVVLQEATARLGADRVFEIDATGKDLDQVAKAIFGLVRGPDAAQKKLRPGRVDWSQDVLAWY